MKTLAVTLNRIDEFKWTDELVLQFTKVSQSGPYGDYSGLKNIKDNNWFPVGLAARGSGVNLSDDCNIKTFDAVRMSMYGIDSAACPNPGNTTNNFKIVQ